jgi:hypothetical protein
VLDHVLDQGLEVASPATSQSQDECAAAVYRPSLRTWCSQVRILPLIQASSFGPLAQW